MIPVSLSVSSSVTCFDWFLGPISHCCFRRCGISFWHFTMKPFLQLKLLVDNLGSCYFRKDRLLPSFAPPNWRQWLIFRGWSVVNNLRLFSLSGVLFLPETREWQWGLLYIIYSLKRKLYFSELAQFAWSSPSMLHFCTLVEIFLDCGALSWKVSLPWLWGSKSVDIFRHTVLHELFAIKRLRRVEITDPGGAWKKWFFLSKSREERDVSWSLNLDIVFCCYSLH